MKRFSTLALIMVAGLLHAANPSFQDTTNIIRWVSFPVSQYEIDPASGAAQSPCWKFFSGGTGGTIPLAPSPFTVSRAAVATNRSGLVFYDLPPRMFEGFKTNIISLRFGFTNGFSADFNITTKLYDTNYAVKYTPVNDVTFAKTILSGTNIVTFTVTNTTATAWAGVGAAYISIYDDNVSALGTNAFIWFLGGSVKIIQ